MHNRKKLGEKVTTTSYTHQYNALITNQENIL